MNRHPLLTSLALFLLLPFAIRATVLDPSQFELHASISFPGYTGGNTALEGLPVLVKLSPSTISGFSYVDCLPGGADLRFADANGNLIPHEIDTWDTSGTSCVWVRVPSLSGTDTTITLYWSATVSPDNLPMNTPTAVWSDYVAVWHMNAGLADATGKGNSLVMSGNGSMGGSALIGSGCGLAANTLQVLSTSKPITNANGQALSTFSISGWFRPSQGYSEKNARLFSTKPGNNNGYKMNGFEFVLSSNRLIMRGDGSSQTYIYPTAWPDHFSVGSWTHVMGIYSDTSASSFFDGVESGGGGTIAKITDASRVLGIGNTGGGDPTKDNVFAGTIDEVRIYNGVASALRAYTEFATMASNAVFTSYGSAVGSVYYPRMGVSLAGISDLSASFTGRLSRTGADGVEGTIASSADVYFSYAPIGTALPPATCVTNGLVAGDTFSALASGLSEGIDYAYAFYVTNSAGIGTLDPIIGNFSTHANRTLRVVGQHFNGNMLESLDLAIGGKMDVTNTLFAVYGPTASGTVPDGWATCERVAIFPPGPASYTYTMPDGWGTTHQALQLFLVRGRVPDYDTTVEYVRSSGTEYFDTDYFPNGSSVLEVRVHLRSNTANTTLFCARGDTTSDNTFTVFHIGAGDGPLGWRRDYANVAGTPNGMLQNTTTIYTVRMDYAGLVVNGETIYTGLDAPVDFTTPHPAKLLASYLKSLSGSIGNNAPCDLYYFKAWDNDELSREYIPCIRDGIVCLYETQTGTFAASPIGNPQAGPVTTAIFDNPSSLVPEAVSPLIRNAMKGCVLILF